ncbi:MAG: glycosyl hydrolase family 18 protein [Eubacteriales bacterium]
MVASILMPTSTASATTTSSTTELRNVMYYGDWSIWGGQGNFYPTDMPADLYTHLNYAFMDFDADGNLIFCDTDAATSASLGQSGVTWGDVNAGLLPALTSLRADNPNMKIGISVGGWSKSGDFSAMAASDTARANFVSQIVAFVEYTGMDFVDIDWEYPASVREPDYVDNANDEGTPDATEADKENYIILLQDLRDALDEAGAEIGKTYELSVALPIDRTKLENGVDVDAMFDIIDFGNLMTYDARGAWDTNSGHQTALYGNPDDPMYDYGYSIDQTVQYMIEEGAPSEKLVIGAAFYTRGWESVSDDGGVSDMPGLFGTAEIANLDADQTESRGASNEAALSNGDGGRNGGIWAYRSLDALNASYSGLVEYWDDVAQAPYLYNGSAFFTYDNVQSVTAKANYAVENNLGGVISWMASNDATTTSTQRDELTSAIYEGLYGTADLPDNEIIVTPLDLDVSVTELTESWGSTVGYTITITNNETATETNAVLQAVEAQKETIMLPKLYIDNNGVDLVASGYGAGTVTNEDGITVVDLGSVYDNKLIAQGASISFSLAYSGSTELDMDNLESIELVQRTYTGGTEINPQVIYGESTDVATNSTPVFSGTSNRTLEFGAEFDILDGVAATDKEDGDLTDSIVVTGDVDTSVAGSYTVTYTVTDSEGATATASRKITVNEEVIEEELEEEELEEEEEEDDFDFDFGELDFGVGQGIEWETGIFAPFADMGAWVTDATYSNSGALDLGQVMDDTGIKYFNAGFINAVDSSVNEDGVLNWGFGGYEILSEDDGQNDSQYNGIKEAIADVRANGGDVVISIGGLNEGNFFQYTDDLDVLVNTYVEIIDGFNLTRIDLDIEGGAQGYAMNELNAEAMKLVQDETGVEVVLTLPVLPTGLTESLGLPTLQAYLDAGVDVEAVNIMAMCYGTSFGDYADATVEAIDSTMEQIKDAYKEVGITLTDEEAYAKVAITTSIGYEGSAHPIFTVADSTEVVAYAAEKEINFVSFWSINRDSETQDNTGIYGQYEHTDVYLAFQDGSIELETPETPETETPETEELPELTDVPVWTLDDQAQGLHVSGYIVQHNGVIYENVLAGTIWWCEPGTNDAIWSPIGTTGDYETPEVEPEEPEVTPEPEEPEVTPEPEEPEVTPEPEEPEVTPDPELPEVESGDAWTREIEATGIYVTGSIVTYKGVTYEQVSSSVAWWCEPGSNSSVWKAIGTDSSYVATVLAWTAEDQSSGLHTPGTYVTYDGVTYLQVSTGTSWWCTPGTNSAIWAPVS